MNAAQIKYEKAANRSTNDRSLQTKKKKKRFDEKKVKKKKGKKNEKKRMNSRTSECG